MTENISALTNTAIAYLDRPPRGWHVLDVMRQRARAWDWVALMVSVDPDDRQRWRHGTRSGWVRIPGKHKNREAAWDALEDWRATRH